MKLGWPNWRRVWWSPAFGDVIRRSLLLIVRAAPGEFWRIAALNVVFGAGPAVLLWLSKVVIDQITALAQSSTPPSQRLLALPAALLWGVAGFVLLNLLLDGVETLSSFEVSALRDRVSREAQQQLYAKVAGFRSVVVFESPELLNLLVLAEASIGKLHWLTNLVTNLMTGASVLVPTIILSASIAWWVPLLIVVVTLPSVYVQFTYQIRQWSMEESQAGTVRAMRAHEDVLLRPAFAKDVRMYGLAGYFLAGWRRLFDDAFGQMQAVRRRGTAWTLVWSLISGIGTGLPYVYVVAQAVMGRFTLGDVALYAGLVFEVRRSLFILIGNTVELQQVALAAGAFFKLLDYREPDGTAGDRQRSEPNPAGLAGIVFHDVAFTYPGATRPALRAINLRIEPGATAVIVGDNGAGKTTLAKLLCRLYVPSDGHITWNGADLETIELEQFRREIAVVFQDVARFPATLGQNIAFGALDSADDAAIRAAASHAGLDDLLAELPRGLDTPLSKQFDDGTELSGGQWQRVAIARALLRRDARMVILDEPTAALDPQTEYEVLRVFGEMTRGKTAVIISHRLALARIASTIVVMERGTIVEQGSHAELMRAGGRYATMFLRQASHYVDVGT